MQRYRRSVIVAFLAAAQLGLAGPHQARADAAGPIIPLPDTDRAQLDWLLGKAVVGGAFPSAPLAGIDAHLPTKDIVMSMRVVTSDKGTTTEAHPWAETWSRHQVRTQGRNDLSNLKTMSHSGSLDVTYAYVGMYRVIVPSGTYDA